MFDVEEYDRRGHNTIGAAPPKIRLPVTQRYPPLRGMVQYLRQYMKHLRRKLEDDPARPRHLLTESGMGYRFQP